MVLTLKAPDLTPGYPSKGPKLGPAWSAVWAELAKAARRKDPYVDGRVLAESLAAEFELDPATLVGMLSRFAKAGILDRQPRKVTVQILHRSGKRTRTFYRINTDG
jgi:hypothetical protein